MWWVGTMEKFSDRDGGPLGYHTLKANKYYERIFYQHLYFLDAIFGTHIPDIEKPLPILLNFHSLKKYPRYIWLHPIIILSNIVHILSISTNNLLPDNKPCLYPDHLLCLVWIWVTYTENLCCVKGLKELGIE